MRRLLLCALLIPATAYFTLIAIRPVWLTGWSIPLALGVIWYGFAVTVLYTWLAKD